MNNQKGWGTLCQHQNKQWQYVMLTIERRGQEGLWFKIMS